MIVAVVLFLLLPALCVLSILLIRKSSENFSLKQKLIEAEIRLSTANEKLQERELLEKNWKEQFEQLSAKALRDNNETFLLLAQNSFNALSKQANVGFDNTVKPIENTLKLFDEKLSRLESQRQSAYFSLAEQLKISNQTNTALKEETNNLFNALRRPDVRGQWGEMQLRKTVELAGMLEHVDFEEQASVTTSDGQNFRPDMVIKLPSSRIIVVDAKVPLAGYLEAISAKSEMDQRRLLSEFASQLKRHIERLSSKGYWQQFENCPEFVILFLPGEHFLSDAFRADPKLLDFGAGRRVILATPATFIAMLKAIAYGWKQAKLAEEAQEIAKVGREMYARLQIFLQHFNGVGKSLAASVEAFNKMRASADARLMPQVRKLYSLGLGAEAVAAVDPVEVIPQE